MKFNDLDLNSSQNRIQFFMCVLYNILKMEKGYFLPLSFLILLIVALQAYNPLSPNCPIQIGTVITATIRISIDGDIKLNNQDSYCYNYTLNKYFNNAPKVAVSLNKFQAASTRNMYLAIKPLQYERYHNNANNINNNFGGYAHVSHIGFSAVLYKAYTQWTLIEFQFIAQDKTGIEVGHYLVDGAQLSGCQAGKSAEVYFPLSQPLSLPLKVYTFLNGFQISSKNINGYTDHYSPLQIQIINKAVSLTGITISLTVTSITQVYSVIVSYVVFNPTSEKNIKGGFYTYDNYEQFPSAQVKTPFYSVPTTYEQLSGQFYGLSGFIINWNAYQFGFGVVFSHVSFNFTINNYWKYFTYQVILFMGGLCADCTGYPIYYQGDCLSACPANTVFNGYTCITCALSEIWNGTHCINRCQGGKIFNQQLGVCQCALNYEWTGTFCSPCLNGKVYNYTTKLCACPQYYFWTGTSCIICSGGKVYNQSTQTCSCPYGYYWGSSSCVSCSNGQYWNQTINACQCPLNTFWNGYSCLECSGGRVYNYQTKQCECVGGGVWNGYSCFGGGVACQGGKQLNPITNICQCRRNTYQLNGGCIACGSLPNDYSRLQCMCSQPNSFYNGVQCITCGNDRVWNPHQSICSCPLYHKWNGQICVKDLCNKGYEQIGGSCFCPLNTYENKGVCTSYSNCSSNQIWNEYTRKCQQIGCSPGTFWNGQTCQSFQNNNQNDCPYQTYWNGFYCSSYTDTCPQGTEWTGDYCKTIQNQWKCLAGSFWTGSSCQVIPSECPAQLIWKDARNSCVPVGNQCPNGTYYNGFTCISYSSCGNGKVWSKTLVQCICPQTSHWNGQSCVKCSGGMLYGFQGCFCPVNQFYNTNTNTCQPITLPDKCTNIPNSIFNGSFCQCLPGYDKYYETCICNGIVINGQCDRCSLKPHSVWNGYVCACKVGFLDVNGACLAMVSYAQNVTNNSISGGNLSCSVGTYFQTQQQRCVLCSDGCMSCQDSYKCKQCRVQYNYFQPSKSCLQICGDGKRFSLQCDDNNNINGDGCSTDCKIQSGYTCFGGSPNSKDQCTKFKPAAVEMLVTGQTHLFGKIVLNVKLNYLPTNLTTSDAQCNASCDKILLVNITEGFKTFMSIKSSYVKTTSFTFSIEIEFGREPIGSFKAEVSINPAIKEKYFTGIQTTQKVIADVNPAFMARVDSDKNDVLV